MSLTAGRMDGRVTPDDPAPRPLALARQRRAPAPTVHHRGRPQRPVKPEWVPMLDEVERTSADYHRLAAELERAIDRRRRAVMAALDVGVPRTRIGVRASPEGHAPLSRRQVNRLAEALSPWRD